MRKRTRARRPFTSIVGLALTLLLLAPAGMSSATAATIAAQTPAIAANETTAQSTQPFTDVRLGRDFYDEISWMAANGISNGWTVRPGVKEYRPNERVLRDQMAAFMYRLAGSPEFTAPATSPFTDIRPGQTFYKEIAWLAESGVSNGWAGANGTRQFRPGQPVLRDQMAAFMYRLAGSPEFTPPKASRFTDIRPGQTFYKEIAWLAESGVSNGWASTGGTRIFGPGRPVLRDQMAAFMYRLDDKGLLDKSEPEVPEGPDEDAPPGNEVPVGAPLDLELKVVDEVLMDGIVGLDYLEVLNPEGAMGDVTWTATGLPAGLTISTDGVITGIPKAIGKSDVRITATDATGATGTRTMPLNVPIAAAPECIGKECDELVRQSSTVEVPVDQVEKVDTDTSTQEVTAVTLRGVTVDPGEVLILPATVDNRTGALVRVQSVSRNDDGSVTAAVTTAKLNEAFVSGDFSVTADQPVTMLGGAAATTAPAPTPSPTPSPTGNSICEPDVEAQIEDMTFTPNFKPKLEGSINSRGPEFMRAELTGTMDIAVTAALTGSGSCELKGRPLELGGMVGGVWMTFTMTPVVKLSTNATATVESSVRYQCHTVYQYTSWSTQEPEPEVDCQPTDPKAEVGNNDGFTASLTGGADMAFQLYKTAGIDVGIDTGLHTSQIYARNPQGMLEAKLDMDAGMCLWCFFTAIDGPQWLKDLREDWSIFDETLWARTLHVWGGTDLTGATTALPPATLDEPYEAKISAAGGMPSYDFARIAGNLPAGLTLHKDGTVSGTPETRGTETFKVLVFDEASASTSFEVSLAVEKKGDNLGDMTITTAELPSGTVGSPYSAVLEVEGGTSPYAWAIVGDDLPEGLRHEDGRIVGTPAVAWKGTVGLRVSDGANQVMFRDIPLEIKDAAPLQLTDAVMHPTDVGEATERTFFVTGGTKPFTFTRTAGAFPPGMSLDAATGKLTGTPTKGGEYEFTVKVTDATGKTDETKSFLIVYGDDGVKDPNLIYATVMDADWGGNYFVKPDGTVWAWDDGWSSALGSNTLVGDDLRRPSLLPGPNDTTQLAIGFDVGFALQSDGTVWTWGDNRQGAMGIGPREYTIDPIKPTKIPNLTDVVHVAQLRGATFAVKSDGTVWAWGGNYGGLLGLGETVADDHVAWYPTQIPGLSDIKTIETGYDHVYALTKDGTVWAWGDNTWGSLGDGSELLRKSPVRVKGLDGVVSLTSDDATGYAVKADGTVWAWGYGIDDPTQNSPFFEYNTTPALWPFISDVKMMDADDRKLFVVKNDGTVWSAGYSVWPGPLGIGEQNNPSQFVQLNHLTGVISVVGGDDTGFAITRDGGLWGWGKLGSHYVPKGAPHGMLLEPTRLKS